jgi:hypothetical protein
MSTWDMNYNSSLARSMQPSYNKGMSLLAIPNLIAEEQCSCSGHAY